MRLRRENCDACGRALPLARLRRLVWARVCAECASALQHFVPAPEAVTSGVAPVLREILPPLLRRAAGTAALLGVAHLLGPGALLALGGALFADLVSWTAFALLMAPFQGVRFSLDMAVRSLALAAAGVSAPDPGELLSFEATAAFFCVLVLKALWFGLFWVELTHDTGDPAELERFI